MENTEDDNTIVNTINEECQELKNIKYKTMLLNGSLLHETKSANDLSNLDKFLENEKNNNINEPWCKLNKTIKTKKIIEYIEIYKKDKDLNEEETVNLTRFLKECLDKKKLSRVKDVIYDKVNGVVKEIPALTYTKANKHFTLKNIDKRISTLKSLAPKKVHGTIRNKAVSLKNDNENANDNNSDIEDTN
jgi:hypothetical protein